MDLRKRSLIGSASIAAILCAAGAGLAAATDTDPTDESQRSRGHRHQANRCRAPSRSSATATTRSTPSRPTTSASCRTRTSPTRCSACPGVNTESAASGEGGFDENDRVSIRGTSPSLTQVTVDGHAIATGDWFILDQYQAVGRSVSFNLLPAEMVAVDDRL